jgi:aspartate/tyrosine/aromatic aminotransferase
MMSGRMKQMRIGLRRKLIDSGTQHNWDHLVNQIGMFAFTGLDKTMIDNLRERYGIYMTADGRISIAGLNTGNLSYIADAFHSVTKNKKF